MQIERGGEQKEMEEGRQWLKKKLKNAIFTNYFNGLL